MLVNKRESGARLTREFMELLGPKAIHLQHREHVGLFFQFAEQRLIIRSFRNPGGKNVDRISATTMTHKTPKIIFRKILAVKLAVLRFRVNVIF